MNNMRYYSSFTKSDFGAQNRSDIADAVALLQDAQAQHDTATATGLLVVLDKGTNREQRLSAESFSDDAGQGLQVAITPSSEDSAREYRIYLPENTVHRKTEQGNWLALNLDEADASPFVADIHKAAVGISHFL